MSIRNEPDDPPQTGGVKNNMKFNLWKPVLLHIFWSPKRPRRIDSESKWIDHVI